MTGAASGRTSRFNPHRPRRGLTPGLVRRRTRAARQSRTGAAEKSLKNFPAALDNRFSIWYSTNVEITAGLRARQKGGNMELRIARFTAPSKGREYRYHVVYPVPAPVSSPKWLIIDREGEAIGDSDSLPPHALSIMASTAVERGVGEPLEKRITLMAPSARKWAEELGWVARYGPGRNELILPGTRVFFCGGLPAGLREQAAGDLRRALRLLADCVRKWDADPAEVFESLPEWGEVVTAAELAAGQ